MENQFLKKFRDGGKPLGSFFECGSEAMVEAFAFAGMDYLILDTEHGPWDVVTIERLIRAAKLAGITPFVRVKDSNRNSLLKMLDAGAMGLVIPNVQSAEEARAIVREGKFFPLGERGVCPTSGTQWWTQDYASQGLEHYFEVSNRETLLIPQCETAGALRDIEQIINTDGIDGIFLGPLDLSVALGKPGDYEDQTHMAAVQKVADLCNEAGKFSMIYAGSVEEARLRYDQGYSSVAYGIDVLMMMNAVKEIVAKLG